MRAIRAWWVMTSLAGCVEAHAPGDADLARDVPVLRDDSPRDDGGACADAMVTLSGELDGVDLSTLVVTRASASTCSFTLVPRLEVEQALASPADPSSVIATLTWTVDTLSPTRTGTATLRWRDGRTLGGTAVIESAGLEDDRAYLTADVTLEGERRAHIDGTICSLFTCSI